VLHLYLSQRDVSMKEFLILSTIGIAMGGLLASRIEDSDACSCAAHSPDIRSLDFTDIVSVDGTEVSRTEVDRWNGNVYLESISDNEVVFSIENENTRLTVSGLEPE
jgi:hypothetical protein